MGTVCMGWGRVRAASLCQIHCPCCLHRAHGLPWLPLAALCAWDWPQVFQRTRRVRRVRAAWVRGQQGLEEAWGDRWEGP